MLTGTRDKGWDKWVPAAAALLCIILIVAGREVLYPVRALMWHANALIWWLVILAGALGQGTLLLKVLAGDRSDIPSGLALALAAGSGLGMFSLEVLLIGALGLMSTPVLTGLVLLVLAVSLTAARGTISGVLARTGDDFVEAGRDAALPLAASLITFLVVFPLVLVPTRAFDALSYHLEVPLRYLQAGGIVNIPENTYSYAPLLTQMLYGLGLGLEGPALAGLLYFTFFILTIWILWKGGETLFGTTGSAWAAALFALTPVFLIEVPQSGADWSLTCFLAAALLLAAGGRDTRRMILAGILAGMAASCRHQGLVFALVLMPAAGLLTDMPARKPGSFRSWSVFTVAATLTACPWYLKNLIQTGDPIYPLLTSMTGGLGYDSGFVDGLLGSKPMHLLWSWVLVPYQAVFDPLSLSMTATVGILPLGLLLLLPCLRGRSTGSRFLLVWAILAFFSWHLTFRTFRYAMPVTAIVYLWLGAALACSLSGSGRWEKLLKYTVCLALAVNGGTFLGLTDYVNRNVAPALGIGSAHQYLSETYRPYPAIEYLNSLDQPPAGVLFVGEMRGFYAGFSREVASHNAPNRLFEMIKEGKEPGHISGSLADAGFTHILFNPGEWERMAYENLNAPLWKVGESEKRDVYSYLRDHTRLLFDSNGVSVHRITIE